MKAIDIRGARTHNLKNVEISLPRGKLIVFTGLSGSGKSSLAFDTIYAEGRRRYVESLSTYARQFLSVMEKPDVDYINGLSPAISIEQKSTSHNPRSTVGTVTEMYDYLRLLFARTGIPFCPVHKTKLEAQSISEMVDKTLTFSEGTAMMMLAPVIKDRKGEHLQLMRNYLTQGFIRARINGEIIELSDPPSLERNKKHTIEIIVDRFRVKKDMKQRLAESFETALKLSEGVAHVSVDCPDTTEDIVFSDKFACNICGYSLTELEPRLFSFNNPVGACQDCDGLGVKQFFDPDKVVVNENLSLAGGAIRGRDRNTGYYFSMIKSLANHYKFDVEKPYKDLSKKIKEILLFGSGNEKIRFSYASFRGRKMSIKKTHTFEGIIPNLDRRYHETESNSVRDELGKYLNTQTCPNCDGTRLNISARNVLINDISLPEISAMSVEEAKEYFKNMLTLDYKVESDTDEKYLHMAFTKTEADARKKWILDNITSPKTLDYTKSDVRVKDLINKELVLFSIADNVRSIPSLVDGLKPSQRKIIYSCIKRNLYSEIKVSQLAGYVSEVSSYHHGEASLQDTIIGLSQTFVGSNNINLLEPVGQFGTRLLGGKDSSSPRYIFTHLSKNFKNLFNPADFNILNYLDDDGFSIEPTFYVPTLPLILINGACGIGTGFSTDIPCFNPDDLKDRLLKLVNDPDADIEELMPWYKGFNGTITKIEQNKWITRGVYKIVSNTVTITELPIGTWTEDYKSHLDKLETDNEIYSYINKSTETNVHFELKIPLENIISWTDNREFDKKLKLTSNVSAKNIHVFNERNEIIKIDSVEEIVYRFWKIRCDYYTKRQKDISDRLSKELNLINSKISFVNDVIDENVKVFRQKISYINEQCIILQ